MDVSLIDYDHIFSQLPASNNIEELILTLSAELVPVWCEQYRAMTPTVTNILQFNVDGFEFLFDFSSQLVEQGVVPENQAVEDRVVAVFGRSRPASERRDTGRMKGFLGPTAQVFGENYDKGHFVGHSLGGGLDVNLFPQRKDINRGWSRRGKVYREMEQYCVDHPGTFCFSRPLYRDRSWRPHLLEYGLLTGENTLWVERFEN